MSRRTMRFEEVVDYGATPERIYNLMIYPDTLPDLDTDITYWQPDELPPRVGTLNRFKWKVSGMPTFVELVSRYVEIDPPRRFVVEGVRPSFAKAGRWTVELEELSGGTRGKTDFEITAPTWAVPFARLLLAFIHRGTRKSMLSLQQRLGPPR